MKRINKWLPKKGVFRRFLVTYIIIMLSFICAIGLISNIMLNSITEYDRNRQYQAANNSNEMLNQQMKNIRNLCTQIKSDTDTSYTSFLRGRKSLININDGVFGEIRKNIFENLSMSVALNSMIEDIYVFSGEDDMVVFSHGSVDMDIMYGSLLKFGDMSLDEFRKSYLSDVKHGEFFPAMNVYNTGENTQSVLYIESYPAHPFSKPTGYIVISIRLSELLNILGYTEDNEIYLYDPDGKLLYSSLPVEGELKIDEEGLCTINGNKYITYSSQNKDSLNFVGASLYNSALKRTISMRLLLTVIVFCVILIGFMLSVYFAKFNTKPIKGLMDKLETLNPDGDKAGDEYTAIAKSIDSIVNNMMLIEKDFEEERPVLINDFVNSILIGKYMTQPEIEKIAKKLRVDISGNKFAVMLLEIVDREADNNRERLRSIQKSISTEFRQRFNCLTNMNGMDSVYIIFKFDDEDVTKHMESIENVTYTISDTLYESLQVRLKCAIGGFYDSILDVMYSNEGAKGLLEKGTQVEYRNIIWCVQSEEVRSWYYYPNEIEQRIENSFRSNAINEIDHILNLVREENYINRVLDSSTIRLLYMNMKITVHNIMRQFCAELGEKRKWKLVDDIVEGEGMDKFFKTLSQTYHILIEESETKSLKQEILDYVNKAALDMDFDRHVFAKNFFISPDYVSKFFKENTGYGFTKYATKVRIDKACELLRDGNYTIERISEAVGYSSALSFRRAFKNYMGISPSDYRRRFVDVEDEN